MAGSPFKIKETAKEKEALLEKQSTIDKIPTKDKHEKEKSEQDNKPHKDAKDHKEQKDQKEHKDKQEKEKHEKEKQEKEGKNEAKDHADKWKHEKEARDKYHAKEHLPKEIVKDTTLEKLPEAKQVTEAGEPAAAPEEVAAPAATAHKVIEKFADKTHIDKVHKEKDKFEKVEKHEKFEIKEFDKVLHDVKYLEGPVIGPGPVEGEAAAVADRVAALEATVSQLLHFIPAELRPDLSKGALKQEPEAQQPEAKPESPAAGEAQPEPHKKENEKKK